MPFNLLGIIFSLVALSQIRNNPQAEQGRPLAIAGLGLSVLSIVLSVLFVILGLALNGSDIVRKLEHHEISAMPVVDQGAVLGRVSADVLARRSLLRLILSQADQD